MIVSISSDAEADIAEGYWFYERQSPGLGDYFRSCLIADIESLAYYGGIRCGFARGSNRGGQNQAMQRTRDEIGRCGSSTVAGR
ncbi:MAG: hypothetical protein ACKOEX_10670 [Planctomycetia bacterium]